jgi:hypothetical protein
VLRFPDDRIVGTVGWAGSWSDLRGPVLATGPVVVPDTVDVSVTLQLIAGTEATGGGCWTIHPAPGLLDLGFVADLPAGAISSLSVRAIDESKFGAIRHLGPGLSTLCLVGRA